MVTDGGWGFVCPICKEVVNCTFKQVNNYVEGNITTCDHLKRNKNDRE